MHKIGLLTVKQHKLLLRVQELVGCGEEIESHERVDSENSDTYIPICSWISFFHQNKCTFMGQVRHKSSRIILQAYKSQKPKILILETIGIERF
jgi:hypothetical protein